MLMSAPRGNYFFYRYIYGIFKYRCIYGIFKIQLFVFFNWSGVQKSCHTFSLKGLIFLVRIWSSLILCPNLFLKNFSNHLSRALILWKWAGKEIGHFSSVEYWECVDLTLNSPWFDIGFPLNFFYYSLSKRISLIYINRINVSNDSFV